MTAYGDGMVEHVRALGSVDLVLDTVGGALPDLIRVVDGNPKRVLSIADRSRPQLGVRGNYDEGLPLRYETFGEMAQAAAAWKFSIPIARTFPLEQWREAMEISVSVRREGSYCCCLDLWDSVGQSNREISVTLGTAEATVKNQASSIFSKLGVRDRTRAVLRAIELGVL